MRVLMISGDPQVFDVHSAVFERMKQYAHGLEWLHVVVPRVTKRTAVHEGNVLVSGGDTTHRPRAFAGRYSLVTAQDPFEYGLWALVASWYHDAPLELQIHTDIFSPQFVSQRLRNRVRVALARRVLPRAQAIRVVSRRLEVSLRRALPHLHAPIAVIPVPVSLEDVPAVVREPGEVLLVSRLAPEKNISTAILAFAQVHARNRATHLRIVGAGALERALRSQVEKLGIAEQVTFSGWMRHVGRAFARASVFVQLSSYEGYGMSLMEAALYRCPIVTTDVGVVGYELPQHEVVVVDNTAVADVVRGIEMQLRNPLVPRAPVVLSRADATALIHRQWRTIARHD